MSDNIDETQLSMTAVVLSVAGTVFGGPFLHPNDVKEGNIEETRRGETVAASIVLGTGFVLAMASKSRYPLLVAVLATAVYCTGIEYQLRKNACG